MVSLTFYGGVNEIGGNKVLLEDRNVRVFFDFGEPFNMGCDFFTGWLEPRAINGLGDYFEFGLLPKLRGLYAKEQLQFTDLSYVEPRFDAVFLSHAHFDHANHIQFLDSAIPVHLGVGTKFFLEAMEKTSGFCAYGPHRYETFRTGDKIEIGNLTVEPVHVDHSIPAAYGFIIHTSEGIVVYTGDLRLHGPRADLTEDFVETAKMCEPVALVSEGTRVVEDDRRQNYSEKQVEMLADNVVSKTRKMVFVTHYSRDMDRFRTFYQVTKKNGRKLVISPKTAYLLSRLVHDAHLDLPNPLKDDDVLVYYRRKRSGRFEGNDYYAWEREFLDKMVNHKYVHENQSRLVMNLDFYQFTELIDIKPAPGSHFIHSMSEPFSEEDLEAQILHNWLRHFKMKFHQLHSSGHLDKQQLATLISQVNPRKVYPIHTENPHLFKNFSKQTQIIKCGTKYKL
ncbi:MAG: MBL fold metallo-hydrolase [Candidatus Bathyarchaeia archaeon]